MALPGHDQYILPVPGMNKLRIFYSGEGGKFADPEYILQDKCNLMLTYATMKDSKPNKRYKLILKARKRKVKG